MIRTIAIAGLALGTFGAASSEELDRARVTEAITHLRQGLPAEWQITDIQWETVPFGWEGEPTCVLIRLEDTSMSFVNAKGFEYRSFYKVWVLPSCWTGRMEVAAINESMPHAVLLGDNSDYRVLYRTLGRNSWPEGPARIAEALELHDVLPLTHSPKHSLDIRPMQVLFQRLDRAEGSLARWQRQIYGIAELPSMIYLELLTWEDRAGNADPTFLGALAEKETRYLAREILAAFPKKRSLYLRRVTQGTFSDVLFVNPALAPAP